MDTNQIIQIVMKYAINPLFWLAIILLFGLFAVGGLYIRKRRALKYKGIEFTDYGINTGVPCGWFGIKWYIKGLWTTGREVMTTNEGEIIEEFSESDFIEIDGKRGVAFYRDPISRKLFPISKLTLEEASKRILIKIPPAEFIDNAVAIVKDTDAETSDRLEKLLFYGTIAFLVIGLIIGIILIQQMNNHNTEQVTEMFKDGGAKCLDMCKASTQEAYNLISNQNTQTVTGAP